MLGRGRSLFGDDVDRGRWTELIKVFAQRAVLPIETVVATTLRSYEGVLFGELPENGPARWVLHIGQAGTHRRWSGLQYCSQCLADDREPYFRLTWRLAFCVWCEQHRIQLRDRCPTCGGLVVIHRERVGAQTGGRHSPLVYCPFCGQDRRADPHLQGSARDEGAVALQLQMLRALDDPTTVEEHRGIHPLPYFMGMSMLWSFLDDQKRSAGVWADVLANIPGPPQKPDVYRLGGVERLRIEERRVLLEACALLLEDGVAGLIESLRRAGLSSDKLLRYSGRDRGRPPFWLWEPIRLGIDKTMYVPTTGEIDAAIDHLVRQVGDGYLKIRDVCAFIGMRTNHSARVATRMHMKGVVRPRRPASPALTSGDAGA